VGEDPKPAPTSGRRQVRAVGRVRAHAHRVKVTAEQEARLVELAGVRGITVARLLVESALAGGADSAAERAGVVAELSVLGAALGRVGVNVNQIARVTNATGEAQPATEATLGAVRVVAARLAVVLDGLDEAHGSRRRTGAGVG
jgi:mobilization protein MobC